MKKQITAAAFAISVALLAYSEELGRLLRTGTNVTERAFGIAQKRYPLTLDGGPVLFMDPLSSPSLRRLLPTESIYRLTSSPDIIHITRYSALLIDTNGSPAHLATDDAVAEYLGRVTPNVRSIEDALGFVQAFADLRAYRIVKAAPAIPDVRPKEQQPPRADTDYKFFAEERKQEWQVYVTFYTCEKRMKYDRYIFKIWKPPGGGVQLETPMTIHFGSYVY